jgi:iron complex outermembrane receptor protein
MAVRSGRWLTVLALVCQWTAQPAHSQQRLAVDSGGATAAAGSEATPADELQLQEVTVTARRREENLQSVPISVTAISGADLSRNGVTDINSLQNQVPSLVIASNDEPDRSVLNFVIRGQGQVYGEFTPSVVAYFAEVPTSAPGPSLFYDLQNVQVLKGPQGTLFGKNTTGGAVLFQPNRPTYDTSAGVSVRGGNYDLKESDGFVNLPLLDQKVAARVAYSVGSRKGFTYDETSHKWLDDEGFYAVRLGLLANPTDAIENYFVAGFFRQSTNNSSAAINEYNPEHPLAGLFGYAELAAAQQARGPRRVASSVANPYRDDTDISVTDIATVKLSDSVSFKNILGYRLERDKYANDADGSAAPLIDFPPVATFADNQSRYSEELQAIIDTPGKRFNTIVGLYTDYLRPDPQQLQGNTLVGQDTRRLNQTTAHSYAAFAQSVLNLDPVLTGLKLTGGVRYTKDLVSNRAGQWTGPALFFDPAVDTCETAAADPATCVFKSRSSFHHTSWLISLDYQLASSTLLYVATRNGYKSGGNNGFIPDPSYSAYGLETVQDYELGIKSEFRIGSVPARVNADIYTGNYHEIQRSIVIATATGIYNDIATGTLFNGVYRPNRAVVRGLEFEGTAEPAPGLQISGFYDYTDAFYTNYYLNFLGIGTFNVDYTDFSFTPRNKAGLTADYQLPLSSQIGQVDVRLNYTYQSAERFGNDPRVLRQLNLLYDPAEIPGYGLLNWRVDWTNVMGKGFDLGFFMSNALNRTYLDFEANYYGVLGESSGQYGAPRFFGGEIRYRFGGSSH